MIHTSSFTSISRLKRITNFLLDCYLQIILFGTLHISQVMFSVNIFLSGGRGQRVDKKFANQAKPGTQTVETKQKIKLTDMQELKFS